MTQGTGAGNETATGVVVSGTPTVAGFSPSPITWGTLALDGANAGYIAKLMESTVPVEDAPAAPSAFAVGGAAPNPFRAGTGVVFRLDGADRPLASQVLDVAGRLVRELPAHDASSSAIHWDGRDEAGHKVAPGVYVLRVSDGHAARHARVVVAR